MNKILNKVVIIVNFDYRSRDGFRKMILIIPSLRYNVNAHCIVITKVL